MQRRRNIVEPEGNDLSRSRWERTNIFRVEANARGRCLRRISQLAKGALPMHGYRGSTLAELITGQLPLQQRTWMSRL